MPCHLQSASLAREVCPYPFPAYPYQVIDNLFTKPNSPLKTSERVRKYIHTPIAINTTRIGANVDKGSASFIESYLPSIKFFMVSSYCRCYGAIFNCFAGIDAYVTQFTTLANPPKLR